MRQTVLGLLVPPFAACRFGCAGCCAAPIGVFWIAGIVALVYGVVGGPLGIFGVSWTTVALGVVLWAIASVWAMLVIRGADDDKCRRQTSTLCSKILPDTNEADPLDEARKAR
ncbi:MAG: hypothetical protein WCC36_03655 [Gammaproteobacteria bacterium]